MLACLGQERERFERELARSRYCGHFCVIVEASLSQLMNSDRQLSGASILGSIAAWNMRYCPIILAGNVEYAARIALRWLTRPMEKIEYMARKIKRIEKQTAKQQEVQANGERTEFNY